jgi:predicted nuclease of predicted toxin-antitoxin system
VKFLIDAQLPRRLAIHLQSLGHDVLHTLDLPSGNRTTDTAFNRRSLADQRILITKDADFVNSFLLLGQPFKLLLVATGNIDNNTLLSLFDRNLEALGREFAQSSFVEMNDEGLVVHG